MLYRIFSEVTNIPCGSEDEYEIEVSPEDYELLADKGDKGHKEEGLRMARVKVTAREGLEPLTYRACHTVHVALPNDGRAEGYEECFEGYDDKDDDSEARFDPWS